MRNAFVKSPLDSLLIQILLRRLENEFPTVPATSIVEAIVWAEIDTFPDETIDGYTTRIREFVRKGHGVSLGLPMNSEGVYLNSTRSATSSIFRGQDLR